MSPCFAKTNDSLEYSSELLVAAPQDWHQIRGAQMILTMKAISLGMDVDDACDAASADKKRREQQQEEEEKARGDEKKPPNKAQREIE